MTTNSGDDLQWASALDATSVLMSIHDKDYRIVKATAALMSLLGRAPGKIIGHKCHRLIHGTSRPPTHCPCRRALKTRTHQSEDFLEPRLGMRLFVSCSPIFGRGGQPIGSVHVATKIGISTVSDEVLTNDLTGRQKQVLKLLCSGLRTKKIAAQLNISPRTVEFHRQRMMKMFSARSPAELITRILNENPALVW